MLVNLYKDKKMTLREASELADVFHKPIKLYLNREVVS